LYGRANARRKQRGTERKKTPKGSCEASRLVGGKRNKKTREPSPREASEILQRTCREKKAKLE